MKISDICWVLKKAPLSNMVYNLCCPIFLKRILNWLFDMNFKLKLYWQCFNFYGEEIFESLNTYAVHMSKYVFDAFFFAIVYYFNNTTYHLGGPV